MTRISSLLALIFLSSTLPMCGGSGGDGVADPTPAERAAQSRLRVFLTDKPAEEYSAVRVTIASVRIHRSGDAGEMDGGWMEIPVDPTVKMPVDLLVLRNGVLLGLGSAPLPVGHYQQIRLVLAPNTGAEPPFNQSLVTADGVTHALEVPSGTIKIVHGFSVDTPQATDLTLDFDASQSVKKRGNGIYFMTPVIRATSSTAS